MNSSKLLRVGMPFWALCVISALSSGCQSTVLDERPSVPPAERELLEKDADISTFENVEKSAPVRSKKAVAKDTGKFAYPRFEDTDHSPIYSSGKESKTSSAAVSAGSTYIVRRGDSLSKIAQRHRVRTIDLAKANNLQMTSVIRIGQKLTIPGGKTAASVKKQNKKSAASVENKTAARSGLYVVRRGDSISRIAKRCKVKRADLMAVNNINENTILRIGQTLKLPGAQVVNEESVIVDNKPAVEAPVEKTEEAPAKNATANDADILSELDSDAAAGDKAAEKSNAAESAAAAVESAAAKTVPVDGASVHIQQDIKIDDFCKIHNVTKADLIRLNAAITESTQVIEKGAFIIMP